MHRSKGYWGHKREVVGRCRGFSKVDNMLSSSALLDNTFKFTSLYLPEYLSRPLTLFGPSDLKDLRTKQAT